MTTTLFMGNLELGFMPKMPPMNEHEQHLHNYIWIILKSELQPPINNEADNNEPTFPNITVYEVQIPDHRYPGHKDR